MDQDKTQALQDEAIELVQSGLHREALEIAKRLKKEKWSGCFEVEALVFQDQGKLSKAVRVLKKGTKKCPDVWILWQLLGICLSDSGKFTKAIDAFEKGLQTSEPDRISLLFNKAVTLDRMKKSEEALKITMSLVTDLDRLGIDPALKTQIVGQHMDLLTDSGQEDKAIQCFEQYDRSSEVDEDEKERSLLWQAYSETLKKLGEMKASESAVLKAIEFDRTSEPAQWLLRDIRKQPIERPFSRYQLTVITGNAQTYGKEIEGYVSTYYVLADTEEEAFQFALEFEPIEEHSFLKIDLITKLDEVIDLKGVYEAGPRVFWCSDCDN